MSSSISTKSMNNFTQYVETRKNLIESKLESLLSCQEPELLYRSMRYSALSGGKRLRALLCLASSETIQATREEPHFESPDQKTLDIVLPTACAIEMVHAMSLIHDDLPSLDNDDLRRGKPTNHKIFGDAIALLAGDSLLMHAVETVIVETPETVKREIILDVVKRLSQATGSSGMVGGQVLDLIYTGEFNLPERLSEKAIDEALQKGEPVSETSSQNEKSITPDTVEKIHKRKTGALIEYSLYAGARLMDASGLQLEGIEKFGQNLGLAFQITDDLLDVTGKVETLGKTPGKDQACDKATWIKVFGVDGAKVKLEELKGSCEQILANYNLQNEKHPILSQLLDFAINRKN